MGYLPPLSGFTSVSLIHHRLLCYGFENPGRQEAGKEFILKQEQLKDEIVAYTVLDPSREQ